MTPCQATLQDPIASSCQSSLLYEAIIEEMTTFSGKSSFNSLIDLYQYSADFSEINSMLINEPSPGPY